MTHPFPRWPRLGLALLAAAVAWSASAVASARCADDDGGRAPPEEADARPADASMPRLTLQAMVNEAIHRSQAIGAARLLAEAAAIELSEVRAGALPQASLSGDLGRAINMAPGVTTTQGGQARASLNVGAPIYDGGRLAALTGWRKNLAEAARLGALGAEEQVALQTVSLALDRGRYRLQAQIYQQYALKMSCLVDALEEIVSADRGRRSELVQARKNLQQAELSQSQALSTVRLVETRLRRFVGDGLPSSEGLSAVLLDLPPLAQVQADAERANGIVQLEAQAKALDSYALSVAAGRKPQLSWVVSGSKTAGSGNTTSLLAGVNYSIPLYDPVIRYSIDASKQRAEAARLQRVDALDALRFQMAEVHEQASSAFDRARQTVEIVRNSGLLRDYTLQQWQQLGRRSLFDVMGTEGEHYQLRVGYVNSLFDAEQANALLRSLGLGIALWLE